VEKYSHVAPHDLRRTYAKLAHKGGAKLDQIQLSLGHASLTTTERYLGVRQNLDDAPCDYLKLDLMGGGINSRLPIKFKRLGDCRLQTTLKAQKAYAHQGKRHRLRNRNRISLTHIRLEREKRSILL
jgi:hypothetical protein